ncbi:type I polyketide synthase [Sorangium sp. So ce388]|uniref:type I polyketide synthase n=1 Tax=Sorangium sp. So ce388 TaxID=3133309 RepID=UPI003F5C56A2
MTTSTPPAVRKLLEDATVELRRLRREVASLKEERQRPIAIVGMGCRYPGGTHDMAAYWNLLSQGVDAVVETRARWPEGADERPPEGRWAGLLEAPDAFDAAFFGISPREAAKIDPQHRMLLEVAWEALEDAGIPPLGLAGTRTGVFVGVASNEYGEAILAASSETEAYDGTGNGLAFAAGRLAYSLGLQGPCLSVDTACSSSLVAVHLALRSLRGGECDVAIVGGVNHLASQRVMEILYALQALSPDGRCRTFDAGANGFVRGEGCGALVLKRLSDAESAGDRVWGVIRGSAVNQDGRSTGLTQPNVLAQQALLRDALKDAGLVASDIGYVEAHGTGTSLGDPIEYEALREVLGARRADGSRCVLGSVKTNFGHLEAAAGIAGLMKAVLSLHHERIPRQLHFRALNPRISLEGTPFVVASEDVAWPRGERPRRAGVSSFGLSGTNAHVIVEEAPRPEGANGAPALASVSEIERPVHVLALSGRSEGALEALRGRYVEQLRSQESEEVGDLCYTAGACRSHFEERLAVVGSTRSQLLERLEAGSVVRGKAEPRRIAFLFTGQGSQYAGMGRRLYATQPVYREAVDRCAQVVEIPWEDEEALGRTEHTQAALFTVEYALTELWRSWGVEPEAVMGHSVGEYVAACVAGVMSVEDGLRLVVERGRLMAGLREAGAMASVQASVEEVLRELGDEPGVSVAADNGPTQVVLSGRESALRSACAKLEGRGFRTKALKVSHAFHSELMEPMLGGLERAASQVRMSSPRSVLVSNVTGREAGEEVTRAEYWSRHTREAVRFAEGMRTLRGRGVNTFVEIGPHPALLAMGLAEGLSVASLRRGRDDWETIGEAVAQLYAAGVEFDWRGFDRPYSRRRGSAPTYAWQRQRHTVKRGRAAGTLAPLLGSHIEVSSVPGLHVWQSGIDRRPTAATLVEMVLEAAASASGGKGAMLKEVRFARSIDDGPDGADLQLVLSPESDGAPPLFRIASRADDAAAWRERASGRLLAGMRPEPGSVEPAAAIARVSVAAAAERCPELVAPRVRKGDGEALAELDLDGAEVGRKFRVPPVVLERAFDVIKLAVRPDDAEVYVPTAIEQLVSVDAAARVAWVHVTDAGSEGQTLSGDVRLLDRGGRVLLEARGVRLAPASRVERGDPLTSLLYTLDWRELGPAPRGANGHRRVEGSTWLLFVNDPRGDSVGTELEARGVRVVRVSPGASYRQVGADRYEIHPAEADHLRRLLAELGVGGALALDRVVHAWVVPETAAEDNGLLAAARLGCVSFTHLARALLSLTPPRYPQLFVMTRGAQPIAADGAPPGPGESVAASGLSQSLSWGFGAALAHEWPELRTTLIDADPADSDMSVLIDELLEPDGEDRIALRRGRRFGQRVVSASGASPLGPSPRFDGTVLVTGGLGGLGLALAGRLVDRGARDIALLGRREPSAEGRASIAALEARGARIQLVQADVADAEALARALDALREAGPPLRCVIHTAGVIDDALVVNLAEAQILKVLAPKVLGAWNLHRLTKSDPLDLFVMYSSAVGVFGAPGQAHYAAANAFLDALAHARRAAGLPGVSIDWGRWADVGMAARPEVADALAAQAVRALSVEDALALFEMALGGPPQVIAADVNLSALEGGRASSPLLLDLAVAAGVRATGLRAALSEAPPSQRVPLVLAHLQRELGALLKMPPADVPPEARLPEFGVDSIIATQLVNHLRRDLAMSIPFRLIFQSPSLLALARALVDELMPAEEGLEEAILREIEALSEEEAMALVTGLSREHATDLVASNLLARE